ncbi:hypothetical protein [Actinoplanes sp. URMC 104]|uniref:hypothetical protein n=1 Tax=Actinoplanes sp. URMC 104 TaxID=3423409 RepID=UPI003F1D7C1B
MRSDQTLEARARSLEAHAFRTDCRLRDLEALMAELTGTDDPLPGGRRERLDRLERELTRLSRLLPPARRTGNEAETDTGTPE